jgi:hypothetical protein
MDEAGPGGFAERCDKKCNCFILFELKRLYSYSRALWSTTTTDHPQG